MSVSMDYFILKRKKLKLNKDKQLEIIELGLRGVDGAYMFGVAGIKDMCQLDELYRLFRGRCEGFKFIKWEEKSIIQD